MNDETETLRCAVDELTKRCQELENEIALLKRENQSLMAWQRTVFPLNGWATGHL